MMADENKYKEGDFVKYCGKKVKVARFLGKNFRNYYTYYVEYCNDDYDKGVTVTEEQLSPFVDTDDVADKSVKFTKKCNHSNRYLNKITTAMQFWVCPDCGQEVAPKGGDDDLFSFLERGCDEFYD